MEMVTELINGQLEITKKQAEALGFFFSSQSWFVFV